MCIIGWICYAEKQLGSYVLLYVFSVKSPQQTIGAAIKHHLCQPLGLRYCATLQTCYLLVFGFIGDHFMELDLRKYTM